MDKRKAILLEMKRTAGLASAEEIRVLESMQVVTGNGLVTPRPSRDAAEWLRRFETYIVPHWADAK